MKHTRQVFVLTTVLLAGCARPEAPAPRLGLSDKPRFGSGRLDPVELLDAGREPRAPLRYRYQAGTHEPFVVVSDRTEAGHTVRSYNVADMQVESVDPDEGDVTLAMSVAGDGPTYHTGLRIDARGLRYGGSPDGILDTDRLLSALPSQPVGAGARWRFRRPDVSFTYELIALERGGAHLRRTATFSEKEPSRDPSGPVMNAVPMADVTTEETAELHVAWNRVVPRAQVHARKRGVTETGLAIVVDTSVVPAGAP